MKIFDCFLFFNGLELLELRLMTLNDVVDYFVLVEANKTFTGNTKAFVFEKNRHLYKKYLDKIIYVKVDDIPIFDTSKDIWAIEIFQRNCIIRGLGEAKDEDRIMISDVDEIPDPNKLRRILNRNYPVTFNQHLFYYFVNCASIKRCNGTSRVKCWNGTISAPFKNMDSPQTLRDLARIGFRKIRNAGWHYTYMGGLEQIKLKLYNLSDSFTRIDRVETDEVILKKINSHKDLWDETKEHRLIDISLNNYSPKCMKQFLKKYPNFYCQANE